MRELKSIVGKPHEGLWMTETFDGIHIRPSILIDDDTLLETTVSMDVLLKIKDKIYHITRLDISPSRTNYGELHMNICLPDGTRQDILQWRNGWPAVNIRNNEGTLLALSFMPEKELALKVIERE